MEPELMHIKLWWFYLFVLKQHGTFSHFQNLTKNGLRLLDN